MESRSVHVAGERGGSDGDMCSFAKFSCEQIRRDCSILDLLLLSRSAPACAHVPSTSKTRITGEKFILGGELVVEWAGIPYLPSSDVYILSCWCWSISSDTGTSRLGQQNVPSPKELRTTRPSGTGRSCSEKLGHRLIISVG